MGGGRRFPFPKSVWSPAGGWWAEPKNWKRNTAIAFVVQAFILYHAYNWAEGKTVYFIIFYIVITFVDDVQSEGSSAQRTRQSSPLNLCVDREFDCV